VSVALHCFVWWKSILRSAERNILKQTIGGTVANKVIRSFTVCRPVLQVMLSEIMANAQSTGGIFKFENMNGIDRLEEVPDVRLI
jgi:hypothetical protein